MIGQTLGSYKIVDKIGEGGMGVVYVAEHPLIGRKAAIKLLHQDLSKNEEIVARFFNEARASTLIKHPGIVDIFDFGYHSNGSAYIAMEFLEGESLAARMRREKRLPLAMSASIGKQLAGALGAAHAKGIVHRDLKPDNVYLVADAEMPSGERVKVLDFGIAKLAAAGEATKTRTGSVMGTPAYMSPEQCRGAGEVDHRADVYSLGCMLYEMASGRPPFVAEGVGELIGAHLHMQPEPVRQLDGSIPPGFEAVVMRCLQKAPGARFQKMAELSKELDRFGGVYVTPVPGAAPSPAVHDPHGSTFPDAPPQGQWTGPPVPSQWTGPPAPSQWTGPPVPGTRVDRPTPTTLGGAASETQRRTARGGRGKVYLAAGLALAAGAATVVVLTLGRGDKKKPGAGPAAPTGPTGGGPAGPSGPITLGGLVTTHTEAAAGAKNLWVRIAPPADEVNLGVSYDDVPDDVAGFRPSRKIHAPSTAYELHEHEITWGELDPWLDQHREHRFLPPTWLAAEPADRAQLPATGVPWEVASAYCNSIGGDLPTEEQWEYAARGAERRPYPWGGGRLDPARTRAYAGAGAQPVAVKTSQQDRTPGAAPIWDLAGNALEWTVELWREDTPGHDEEWVEEGGLSYRPIRGLPLAAAAPAKLPQEGAAHRLPLCATGDCPLDTAKVRQFVGFRCARVAK